MGFPNGSAGKESGCNAGDTGDVVLILGSGRSPGEGKWQPTPVFLSENSHGPEPGRLPSKEPQRAGHDWATRHTQALLMRQSWACAPGLWGWGWDESNSSCNAAQTQCNTDMLDSAPHPFQGESTVCFVGVQLLSHVQLFVTPRIAACQAPLSFTIS